MNLIKRLKNLWKLSSLELKPGLYEFQTNLKPKKKMAQIISKKSEIDKTLEYDNL